MQDGHWFCREDAVKHVFDAIVMERVRKKIKSNFFEDLKSPSGSKVLSIFVTE